MPRGCRQACCAKKFVGSPTPKPTSSPTLYFCLVKMGDDPLESWNRQIQCYSESNHFKEMNRIDGMPTEFEWKIFPGITTLGLLWQIQKLMEDSNCELEHFKSRIIFMSMFNDIVWDAKGNKEQCEYNTQAVAEYARKFPRGHWFLLGPGQKKNGTEPILEDHTDLATKLSFFCRV